MSTVPEAQPNSAITKGVEDRIYAVSREGDAIKALDPTNTGYFSLYSDARLIVFDFEHMWSPLFQSGGIDDRAKEWAQKASELTGRPNCLYVTDFAGLNREGNVETGRVAGDQDAYFNGDLSANVDAIAEDIAETAKEEAGAVADAAKKTFDVSKYVAGAIVLLLVLYIVARRS